MEEKQLILSLLRTHPWGADTALVEAFLGSRYDTALKTAVKQLRLDALYQSPIHGIEHILRTMVHGAMGAMEETLSPEETSLLLDGCAYHDVGRINDSVDNNHGKRSAQQLAALTGRTGRTLAILQAAVTAHSLPDTHLPDVLARHGLAEDADARRIALLLKDADGLDRVRIWDLDTRYLRFPGSVRRAGFAKELYCAWKAETGGPLVPDFVRKWKGLDAEGNPVKRSPDSAADHSAQ